MTPEETKYMRAYANTTKDDLWRQILLACDGKASLSYGGKRDPQGLFEFGATVIVIPAAMMDRVEAFLAHSRLAPVHKAAYSFSKN